MTLLPFVSILGIAAVLQLSTKRSMALCIFAAHAGVADLLYLAGLCRCLLPASWAILCAGLLAVPVSATVAAIKGRQRQLASAFLSPASVIFCSAALAFRIVYSAATYQWWDEFSHWGRAVREMLLTNALPVRRTVLLFQDYPPGAALFEYFILRHTGTYSEAAVYFGHFLLLIAPLIVFLDGQPWRRFHWIVIALLTTLLLMLVCGNPLATLNMEMVIAAHFAASLLLVALCPTALSTVALLTPVLFLMPLLKTSGLFLALTCVVAALGNEFLRRRPAVDSCRPAETTRARPHLIGPVFVSTLRKFPLGIFLSLSGLFGVLLMILACRGYAAGIVFVLLVASLAFLSFPSPARSRLSLLASRASAGAITAWLCFLLAPLVAQYSWHSWKEAQALVPSYSLDYSATDLFNAMSPSAPPPQKDVCHRFWRALHGSPIGASPVTVSRPLCKALGLRELPQLPRMTATGWTFVALGLFSTAVLLARPAALRIRIALTAVVVFLSLVIYALTLLSLYLFAFTYAESASLSGLPRYLWAYLFSAILLAFGLLVHIGRSTRQSRPALSKCVFLLCLTFVSYLYLFENIFPVILPPRVTSVLLPLRVDLRPQIQFLLGRTAPEDSIFIIYQTATGMEHNVISYEIFPRRFNRKHFSLGSPRGTQDFWTSNISPQFLTDTIKTGKYKYVYVARADDQLWRKYGGLFDQRTTSHDFLFCVTTDDQGKIHLVPIR